MHHYSFMTNSLTWRQRPEYTCRFSDLAEIMQRIENISALELHCCGGAALAVPVLGWITELSSGSNTFSFTFTLRLSS